METSDSQGGFAKTQLVAFYIILLLAVDSINPVKVFLHVFPQVAPWHIAAISILLMLYVFVSEMKQLLYFSVKVFFHSILSIFFREVQVVGRQNIPLYGPVIFTSNHANQFIDSVVVLCTCQRTISYLMAEKSWNRRIIGDIAWAMGAVPVKRAQDETKEGTGLITLVEVGEPTQDLDTQGTDSQDAHVRTRRLEIHGQTTEFSKQIKVGDKVRVHGSSIQMKVVSLDSDTHMQVEITETTPHYIIPTTPVSFQIMERIDQQKVYESVLAKLASGGAVCIFPEGGSHDRTDLLPLKVGVSLIAYSALEKDGLVVPVVPVGLNYFRGHRFRGRVIVEFGRPTYVDPTTLVQFKKGGVEKRRVCNEFLER
jgi:glycerol-3-phosphate O-acyltransferase/dihydroxyacetone phosphate acyltransferase